MGTGEFLFAVIHIAEATPMLGGVKHPSKKGASVQTIGRQETTAVRSAEVNGNHTSVMV